MEILVVLTHRSPEEATLTCLSAAGHDFDDNPRLQVWYQNDRKLSSDL